MSECQSVDLGKATLVPNWDSPLVMVAEMVLTVNSRTWIECLYA